jgi:hypothetical protein
MISSGGSLLLSTCTTPGLVSGTNSGRALPGRRHEPLTLRRWVAVAAAKAATARRQESEDTIALGGAEVALEAASHEPARAELDKTQLRLKQLRDRLKATK